VNYRYSSLFQIILESALQSSFVLAIESASTRSTQPSETTLKLLAANEETLKLLIGEPETDRLQRSLRELLPTDRYDAIALAVDQCLTTQKPYVSAIKESYSPLSLPELQMLLLPLEKKSQTHYLIGICQPTRPCAELRGVGLPITDSLTVLREPLPEHVQTTLSEPDQLATLINTLPGIVFRCSNDAEWSMTYLSDGCYELTGYHPEELAGQQRSRTYNQITHPDDLPKVLTAIHQSIQQQSSYVVEYRVITKNGEEKWFWEKGRAIYDTQNQPIGLEGFITDISDRKQIEAALVESESRLQAFLNNIPVTAYIKDLDGHFMYVNRALATLLQATPEELLGKRCYEFVASDVGEENQQNDLQVIREKKLFRFDERIDSADRSHVYLATKFPLVDSQGEIYALGGIAIDISDRKQAEDALRQSEQRYQDLYNSAPDMYFSISSNGVITSVNDCGAKMLGYTKAELLGTQVLDLVHPDDRLLVQRRMESIFAERQLRSHLEFRKVCRDGSILWVSEQTQLTLDSNNCPLELRIICRDISEYRQAQDALERAEAKFRSIFENAVEGIFQTTPDGRYITANPMLAKIYGYNSPEELLEKLTNIEHQLYVKADRRQEFLNLMHRNDTVWGFESEIYQKDGNIIWISENARTIRDETGDLIGFEGTVEDITVRKCAEAELRQRDNLLEGVAEATQYLLTETDFDIAIARALQTLGEAVKVDRVYIYENHPHLQTGEPAMSMRYEWVRESIMPTIHQEHWQNQPYSAYGMTRWYETLSAGRSLSGLTCEFPVAEQELLKRDTIQSILMVPILMDEQFWGYIGFDECGSDRIWTKNEQSILIAMAASISGAIKRQEAEAMIRYQAFHDLLTDLPNRTLFSDRLRLALAHAQRNETNLAVMFLDLDRFKTINDTLGHPVGDQLLQAVAKRLSGCLREGDTVSRWGGDEFTLLLPQITSAEDIAKAAQRIIEALRPAFLLAGHELYISSSIGIAIYPYDGIDAQTLLKNADAALYRVKERGRNAFQFYTPAMNSRASELLVLENSLHHALAREQFLLYFQPQLNVITGQITRMEALLRWQHPELGFVAPSEFIAIAEETGLIIPIGEWVLRMACQQYAEWKKAGIAPQRIAVNLSARQFRENQLIETITQVLAENQVSPDCLELEITETTAMQDIEFTRVMLQSLRHMGIHISIDDFGTGYSSLGYLKKFPLDTIKIDRSFIHEITLDPNDAAIVSAVIALGKGLGLSVVAEGVETEEQADHLRSLDCFEMQGYLFSRPLAAHAAIEFLRSQTYQPQTLR